MCCESIVKSVCLNCALFVNTMMVQISWRLGDWSCVWMLIKIEESFGVLNISGSTPYIIDLPYPVGNDANMSLSPINWILHSLTPCEMIKNLLRSV